MSASEILKVLQNVNNIPILLNAQFVKVLMTIEDQRDHEVADQQRQVLPYSNLESTIMQLIGPAPPSKSKLIHPESDTIL